MALKKVFVWDTDPDSLDGDMFAVYADRERINIEITEASSGDNAIVNMPREKLGELITALLKLNSEV